MISTNVPPGGPACDVVIRGGTVFDGAGSPGLQADVAIDNGKVLAVGPRLAHTGAREIDAAGCWVMPGMLDIHTHYDAEIEAMPGLDESVRHGVTTIVMGNCSLSAALGTKKDLLDLFCRVESLPRDVLSRWLGDGEQLPWDGVRAYYDHLETLPIGPNVASFIGHSNIRSHVMGMERSLNVSKADRDEVGSMRRLVGDAMSSRAIWDCRSTCSPGIGSMVNRSAAFRSLRNTPTTVSIAAWPTSYDSAGSRTCKATPNVPDQKP